MGQPKAVLPVRGQPMLRRVVESLRASGVQDIEVVVGKHVKQIERVLEGIPYKPVEVTADPPGMGCSIAAGVLASPPQSAGYLIVLADMPDIEPATLSTLIAHVDFERIIVPTFQGQRGHPVLFGSAHRKALSELSGDIGGKQILAANKDRVVELPMQDPGVLRDYDRPEDFET